MKMNGIELTEKELEPVAGGRHSEAELAVLAKATDEVVLKELEAAKVGAEQVTVEMAVRK